MPINVVIADDHALFRRGLAEILAEETDVRVIAEASNGQEAIQAVERTKPDVVFMDLNMPGQGGIEATAYVAAKWPETKVLILTVSEEPADLYRVLGVGAKGYVLKTAAPQEILDALRQVEQGWVVISPSMAPRFMSDLSRPATQQAARQAAGEGSITDGHLTTREEEILRLVSRGMSNREIAQELIVSENTVKTHVKNILSKLHMKNRSEAAAYAARIGVLRGEPLPGAR